MSENLYAADNVDGLGAILTAGKAAKVIGVSEMMMSRLLKDPANRRKLHATKIGRKWQIPLSCAKALVAERDRAGGIDAKLQPVVVQVLNQRIDREVSRKLAELKAKMEDVRTALSAIEDRSPQGPAHPATYVEIKETVVGFVAEIHKLSGAVMQLLTMREYAAQLPPVYKPEGPLGDTERAAYHELRDKVDAFERNAKAGTLTDERQTAMRVAEIRLLHGRARNDRDALKELAPSEMAACVDELTDTELDPAFATVLERLRRMM